MTGRLKKKISTWVGLNSIHGRLTATAFFFIVGTAVAMGVVGFRYTISFEKARFHEHFQLLADYMASNAELGMLLGNKTLLDELAENMLKVQNVQRIEIIDHQGRIILQSDMTTEKILLGSVSAEVFSRPMTPTENPILGEEAKREILGEVRLNYSLGDLELLKTKLALAFLAIATLLTLVFTAVYLHISRAIRSPLKDLLKVAQKVSAGELNVRAEGGSLQETSTLANAFNEMLVALQLQRRKIQESNDLVARQKALAEVGRFSMTVAHEIKNPLAIIMGSLGPLRKQPEPEIKEKMLSFIDDEIERINKLIEDFLQFARPKPGSLRLQPVDALLTNLVSRIELFSHQVRVIIPFREYGRGKELKADTALLGQALLNIVRNALDATGQTGEVRVTIDCTGEELIFCVMDNGPGIKKDDFDKIFDPFFSKKAKGTGLGLAIAKEAIEAHSGSLTAHNQQGGGACFVLSLPLEKTGQTDGTDTDC